MFDETVFMTGPKPMQTEFGIHQKLESFRDEKPDSDFQHPPPTHFRSSREQRTENRNDHTIKSINFLTKYSPRDIL